MDGEGVHVIHKDDPSILRVVGPKGSPLILHASNEGTLVILKDKSHHGCHRSISLLYILLDREDALGELVVGF